jgi:uncharacterized membrane protein
VLVLLMLAGAFIRHSFVMRHKARVSRQRTPWEFAVAGVVLLVGLAVALAPTKLPAPTANGPVVPVSNAQIQAIMEARCVLCHNAQAQPKGVALHSASLVQQHAMAIYQQAVVLKLMPMNNATQITDGERLLIKQWFETGPGSGR